MDALSDPGVETIVVMSSAQIGKTEIIGNIIGYYIDQDPSPILAVNPTIEMGQTWSKDRLAPMLRDTPCLVGKVKDIKSRDSGNTILKKSFPGGTINISGANSAASLASRPVRVVLCDEVDRYPASAGTEGDPVNLAIKRSNNFWNRKIVLTSTPTIKDLSRIESAYTVSDKRVFMVPCPKCDVFDMFHWAQLRIKENPVTYQCLNCGAKLNDADKLRMVSKGHWQARDTFTGTAGFWINELYSPWVTFAQMAANFLKAKKSPETLKVFVNTSLAETWDEEGGESISPSNLMDKRESYGPEIPHGGLVITAGVDVQDDRLEVEVVAHGKDFESWSIDFDVLHGSPAKMGVWNDLDDYLKRRYPGKGGGNLEIITACIDSGGHHTQEVYLFVKSRQVRRIYATKGSSQAGKPIVSRPSKNNIGKVKLFSVGTDTAKAQLFGRLKIEEPGPGYMHFPMKYDQEYFDQLTAEKLVTKYNKGFATQSWVKTRPRNEALDCRVLNNVALAILNPNFDLIAERMDDGSYQEEKRDEPVIPNKKSFVRHRKGGWMKRR